MLLASTPLPMEKVWKREVPGSPFVAIKSSAILKATQQALFEVLTPGDIDIVKQVRLGISVGHRVALHPKLVCRLLQPSRVTRCL